MGIGDDPLGPPAQVRDGYDKAVDAGRAAETFAATAQAGYDFCALLLSIDFRRAAPTSRLMRWSATALARSTGNIQELFAGDIRVAIPDLVYLVHVDN